MFDRILLLSSRLYMISRTRFVGLDLYIVDGFFLRRKISEQEFELLYAMNGLGFSVFHCPLSLFCPVLAS